MRKRRRGLFIHLSTGKDYSMIRQMLTVTALLLMGSAFQPQLCAQQIGQPGCGVDELKFDVSKSPLQPLTKPADGMALVVVLDRNDAGAAVIGGASRIGLDGKWLSATKGNTYTTLQVDPGVHHLCTKPQSILSGKKFLAVKLLAAATSIDTKAGGVYYYQLVSVQLAHEDMPHSELRLMEPDAGELLRSGYELSVAKPKQ